MMMIKRSIAIAAIAFGATAASSEDLLNVDPVSARIFLELHSIQQLAGDIRPLVSAPGEAFRVVDGDFLTLGNLKIRLVGIDAPEAAQQCNSAGGEYWDCAAQAGDRARSIIGLATRVDCYSSERNNYGHYIASCDADGRDVGALLVEEGLAWPDQDRGYYLSEATTAQSDNLGVWQAPTPTPWEWRSQHN